MQVVLVYLQPFQRNLLLKCAPQPRIAKITKTWYFGSSRSFEIVDFDVNLKDLTFFLAIVY